MRKKLKEIHNENGFVMVFALMIMVVLTLIGIAATNTTVIELTIAGNERQLSDRFYAADSGWKQAVPYLNRRASAPSPINQTPQGGGNPDWTSEYHRIVRNYGNGADGVLNDTFIANQDGALSNVPYWYRVVYQNDRAAVSFGPKYRDFQYYVQCNAAGTAGVATRVTKVFKVGY